MVRYAQANCKRSKAYQFTVTSLDDQRLKLLKLWVIAQNIFVESTRLRVSVFGRSSKNPAWTRRTHGRNVRLADASRFDVYVHVRR